MSNVPNNGSKYGKHLEEVTSPTKPTVINDTNLTPKQTPEAEPTPGQQARSAANRVSSRNKTGTYNPNTTAARPKRKGLTVKNARNAGKRMQKGMGLPGDEDGVNKTAMALYNRDLEIANRSGKRTNNVAPGESPATESFHIHGTHHQRMAQVMHFYGQPEEKIKNLGKGSGATGEIKFETLHTAMSEHKKSKIDVPSEAKGATHWEHPRTGEKHAIAANHPDMPKEFTKKAGETQTVSIGGSGKMIMNEPVTEGWHPLALHGSKETVMRLHKAPSGTPLVDHLRSSIAGSGASTSISSRKRSASKATNLAEGMQRTGPIGKLPGSNYVQYQVTGYKERGAGQPASPVLKPLDFPKAPEGEPVSNVVKAATPETKKATVRPLQRGVVTRKVREGVPTEKLVASARSDRDRKTKQNFSQPSASQPAFPGMGGGVAPAKTIRKKATEQLVAAHPVEDHSVPEGQRHFPGMGMSRQFAGGNWIEAKHLPEKTRELQDKSEQGSIPGSNILLPPERQPAPKPKDTRSHKNKRR